MERNLYDSSLRYPHPLFEPPADGSSPNVVGDSSDSDAMGITAQGPLDQDGHPARPNLRLETVPHDIEFVAGDCGPQELMSSIATSPHLFSGLSANCMRTPESPAWGSSFTKLSRSRKLYVDELDRKWDGTSFTTAPTTTRNKSKGASRSGSADGRRLSTNSIVTRDRRDHTDSSVSRESGASLTSAKTDKVETVGTPVNQPPPVMMQPASASASAVSLSPRTLLFPAALSADLLKYQNAKLFPFPGMKKLEEQRNRAKGMLTPDIASLFNSYEMDGTQTGPSSFSNTETGRERKVSRQASDTRLFEKYAMGASSINTATPSSPAEIDYFNVNPRSPTPSTGSKLPMTLPGVKQWLSSRKKTYTPELSLSPSPLEGTALIHDYCQRLDDLFHRDKMAYNSFLACRGAAAQELLDLLQNLLDYDSNLSTPTRRRLCKALIRLSRDSKLHPGCFTLTGLEQGQHVAGGSFSDVHKALFEGQYVAVKMMRVFEGSDIEALLKEFGREALIWRQLCHPNLLPFFGLYYFQHRLCLVSPWMESGHIRAFLKKKTCDTGRLLSFILDVALGLEHLHEQGVVHGDLKGDNIFVTPSGRACIADFGLSSIITSESSVQMSKSSKPSQGGTTRYQAPELHRGGHNNLCSDIYSFACVAYEMLTGTAPFPELRTDGAVITAVLNGRRPPRPQWCSRSPSLEGLWNLLQSCWNEEPTMRPTAAELVQRLMGPDIQATKNQSATDWDERFTSRFRRHFLGEWYLPSFAELERIFGRQFTCDRCSKQFARMDALNRHLRSGDGVDCQRTLESDSSGDSAGRGHQRSCSMDSDSMGSDSMESDSMESDIIVWRATA